MLISTEIPSTNSWGNSLGVRWASANTAALIRTETGVGTLQKIQEKRPLVIL